MRNAQNRMVFSLPSCFHSCLSSRLLQITVGKKWKCDFKTNDHSLMLSKNCEIFDCMGNRSSKHHYEGCVEMHIVKMKIKWGFMPHFSYRTFLYCAKPCTNYLASKPKGLSQEKSLLNVMHHTLPSVMYWLQEGTEKKNHIFSYLNFKDRDDVQMTF